MDTEYTRLVEQGLINESYVKEAFKNCSDAKQVIESMQKWCNDFFKTIPSSDLIRFASNPQTDDEKKYHSFSMFLSLYGELSYYDKLRTASDHFGLLKQFDNGKFSGWNSDKLLTDAIIKKTGKTVEELQPEINNLFESENKRRSEFYTAWCNSHLTGQSK